MNLSQYQCDESISFIFIKASNGLFITTYSARYTDYSEQLSISDKSLSLRKDSLNLNAYQPQLVNL